MTRHPLLVPLLALAALASGCGDKKIDATKLEARIKEGIQRQAGVQIRSVQCPEGVTVKKGDTFNCRATTRSGQTAQIRVTQRDDEGNVNFQVGG